MYRIVEVKTGFKEIFEGLADVTRLSKEEEASYFEVNDSDNNEHYCVVSGRYRVGKDKEEVAIAIGLWDEEKGCFSVFKKTKDGERLPLPFTVKGEKVRAIIRSLTRPARRLNLKRFLPYYNRYAEENR